MLQQVPPVGRFHASSCEVAKFQVAKCRHVVRDKIEAADGPIVWLNATAIGFQLDDSGRVEKVTARAPNGGRLMVSAKMFRCLLQARSRVRVYCSYSTGNTTIEYFLRTTSWAVICTIIWRPQ